ncbi:S-adenosyl-L-methionine-dependent methyltransferase [Thozetella sp. PMI_491]|nr:S-adenosyl-L-methionine-dependent methyltransferase [Thozetella sp. PMI_491]
MAGFNSTADQWDRYAEHYARLTGNRGPFLDGIFSLADSLRPFSTATAILDNGCGTGNGISSLIADRGAELPATVRLLASDYSKGMVAYVNKLKESPENASNPLWQRLETHVLDAQDLAPAILPSSLSHIVSNLVFMAMDDAAKPISASYRALEDGGVLAFSVLTDPEWIEIWKYAKHLMADKNLNLRAAEVWRSKEALERISKEAGFTTVEIKETVIPMKHTAESLRVFLNDYIHSENPLAVRAFNRPSPELAQKVVDAIIEGVVKEQGAESIVLKGNVKFVGARK